MSKTICFNQVIDWTIDMREYEPKETVNEQFDKWRAENNPKILSINFGTDHKPGSHNHHFIEVLYEK